MSSLPIVYLRQYQLVDPQDWDYKQVTNGPSFDFPVTWFTVASSEADPLSTLNTPEVDGAWTQFLSTTGDTGSELHPLEAWRYYASDGVPPDLTVTVSGPQVFPQRLVAMSITQFAVVGEVTLTNVPVILANYAALTIPGSFTGQRPLIGLVHALYTTARTSQDNEARALDVAQGTDFPVYDATSVSDLTVFSTSYNDFWFNRLIGTDQYAGLITVLGTTSVAVGDVINLGAFSNVTALGSQTWDAWLVTTGAGEYDPTPATKSYKRINSNMTHDVGSLLDSVTVNALDFGVSEQTLLDTQRSSIASNVFLEAMNPATPATGYLALPEQTQEFVNQYTGETLLSRMTRTYGPAVIGKADELFDGSLPLFTEGGVSYTTPQALIDAIFSQWNSLYPWFNFVRVPDLRLRVRDTTSGTLAAATPAQYAADATLGRIGSPALFYEQSDESKLTMRQMLDELLSPFPGTIVRATPGNQLEIVPAYGPDAIASSVVTLTAKDAYQVSQGQSNPVGIINKATVTSVPYAITVDAGVMQDAFFRLQSNAYTGSSSLPSNGTGSDLTNPNANAPQPRYGWNPQAWSMTANVLADGEVKLKDSSNVVQVSIKYYAQGNGAASTHTPAAADVNNIPIDGSTVTAIKTRIFVGNTFWPNAYLRIELAARYNAATRTVTMWPTGVNDFEPTVNFAANPCSVVVQLGDATNKWELGATEIVGTYAEGLLEDTYGDLGGALVSSLNAYGERARDIRITGYGINQVNTVEEIAHAYVMEAISPTLIRTVDQSAWRAFPVKFSDVGKRVTLPSGEVGRVISRSYTDDFGRDYGEGSVTSTIDVEVFDVNGAGYVDPTIVYLLMDSGDLFILDDYRLAEGA